MTISISNVKNSIIYERLNDGSPKRTIQEHIQILKDTNTQMILRSYFRWIPMFPNCNMFTVSSDNAICVREGFTFDEISNLNSNIKAEIPDILIIGAIPAQRIFKNAIPSYNIAEYNDYTGDILTPAQTEAVALDPSKWGITSITKAQLQIQLSIDSGLGGDAWYPDLTNQDVQNLLLGWAKRQIDSGVDGIWIDLLYGQMVTMYNITNNVNHPAVIEAFNAANELIDNIRAYGTVVGRTIYVGTWGAISALASETFSNGIVPHLDFLTATPSSSEVLAIQFDSIIWDSNLLKMRNIFGNIPIFVFIDSTDDNAPMAKFSQSLSIVEQNQFLNIANTFLKSRNTIFSFPIHGLYMGQSAMKLSYGLYNWYDSLAPEFNTYDTIKQLMNLSTGGDGCIIPICDLVII
jgi:hypothetical protein